MTNRRLTLGNSPALQRLLQGRVAEDQSPTVVVSRACERYAAICEAYLPDGLTAQQWNLIFDTLNGWHLFEGRNPAAAEAEIVDHIMINRADRQHEADGADLLARIRTWRYAEWVAVVDAAERFWSRYLERDVHGDPRTWPDPEPRT